MDIAALIITLIYLMNIMMAATVIFIERRDIGNTWAWLMILFAIPVVGFIVYIFFGRQIKKDKFYNLSENEIKSIELAVGDYDHRQGYIASKRLIKENADLITMNSNSSHSILTTDNDIKIINDGKNKFESLFRDIRNAKKEVNIQYYIIQPDGLGKELRDLLTLKAKDGVKVRLLYDAVGSKKIPPSFFKELIAYGGEVKAFFPSFLRLINFRINNRNHRKLCIIDGSIAYIGGFNVGNEYLGLNKKFGYWRDTHLKIIGGAVNQIQIRFILDWYITTQKTIQFDEYSFTTQRHFGFSAAQIISSGPNSRTEHLKNMYIKMIMSAKISVYIQTPYFIPDTSFMDACKMALLSGVDVQIMIPNQPDHPFVYWATWAYAGELISYGAKVYLYENGFLHAKTIVVDEEISSVGTTNIDTRSFKLNFEINATLYDPNIAKGLSLMFREDIENSTQLTLQRYQNRSYVIKFKEALSRLLSPIL